MTVLLPPFQFGCLFFFSGLIAMVELPIMCWLEVGGSGHPCLMPDLRKERFQFLSIEYDVVWGSLIYGLYYVEECSLYSHFAECFHQKWVLYLIKYDHVIFVFAVIDVMHFVYWFANIVPSLHPRMNPTWSWCMIFSMYYYIRFTNILLRILASMFIGDIGVKSSFFIVPLSGLGIWMMLVY